MQNVAWYQGESLKRLLQGVALGAFATLGIEFSWGGFMLGRVVVQTLEVEPSRRRNSPPIKQGGPHSKSQVRFCF
jgi:hypothetical protein